MLVVLSGLPGVGKTTIARELARRAAAVHLRIDSIEQAIYGARVAAADTGEEGYRVAYAVAEDNLRIGRTVIADSVNPIPLTRDAWLNVAVRCQVHAIEVEVRCSNLAEYRRRLEGRASDIPGLKLPTWTGPAKREYASWDREHLILDTSSTLLDQCVETIQQAMHAKLLRPVV
jgi:predicted kinase